MNSAILACIGGVMPKFHKMEYANCLFRLAYTRKDIRDMIPVIPFFWDSEVTFDLLTKITKEKQNIDEYWDYEWQLCDLDDELLKPVVKDQVHVCNIGLRRKLRYWSSGKLGAVKLGSLLPNRHYRLYIKLTSPLGEQNRCLSATFTIKDRDELYMQLLILIIALGFSSALWMLGQT